MPPFQGVYPNSGVYFDDIRGVEFVFNVDSKLIETQKFNVFFFFFAEIQNRRSKSIFFSRFFSFVVVAVVGESEFVSFDVALFFY